MNLTSPEAKWLSIVIVGVGSLAIGTIPTCFLSGGRNFRNKLILSSLLCFGAGVLLATSVLHMLPETRELLPENSELIFCCGFLLLYLVDEISHYFTINGDSMIDDRGHGNGLARVDRSTRVGNQERYSSACLHHGLPNRKSRYHDNRYHDRGDVYEIGFNAIGRNASGCLAHDATRSLHDEQNRNFSIATTNPLTASTSNPTNNRDKPNLTRYGTLGTFAHESSSCGHDDATFFCHGSHGEPCANPNAGLVGVSLALTVHAFLEGLAIGLQKSSSEVLLLLGAVVSHKFVVAFCLGLELAGSAGSVVKNIFVMTLFSGGSVLGIALGMMAVKIEGSLAVVVMPVLQGLAGGTLLYVTVSEILPRERARWHRNSRRSSGIIQFFSVLIGFVLIYCLNRYLDSHHHVLPRH